MSVAPAKESLKEEKERLQGHLSTLQGHLSAMQSRIREIDLEAGLQQDKREASYGNLRARRPQASIGLLI